MLLNKVAKLVTMLPEKPQLAVSNVIVKTLMKKYANIKVLDAENLEGIQKPTIFVCNHLSNSDGLVLSRSLKSVDPTFVAGVKLSGYVYTQIGMNTVKTTSIVPNSTDSQGIKNIINLVKGGENILIFP